MVGDANGSTEPFLRLGCRVETIRKHTARLPASELGSAKPVRERCVRSRIGGFRTRGSNRKFRFAELRRGVPLSVYGAAGRRRIRRLSKANTGPHRNKLRIELWHPLLKRCAS